jgi:hypothetical protein
MNLRLDNGFGLSERFERRGGLLWGGGWLPLGHRDAEAAEHLFGLELMDIHVSLFH